MVIDTTDFLIKFLSGAAAGYFTNFIALKMLISKYPLLGGAIPDKSWEQLNSNFSEQLENSLLKNNYLDKQFNQTEFQTALGDFCDTLINKAIPELLPVEKFSKMPEANQFFSNLSDFLLTQVDLTGALLNNPEVDRLFAKINLDEILKSEQLSGLANKAYDIISQAVQPDLNSFLTELYDQFQDTPLMELVSPDLLARLPVNFSGVLEGLHNSLTEYDSEIDQTIRQLLADAQLDNILGNLEDMIKNKTILDLIGHDNKEEFTKTFINHFIEFINSADGNNFLTAFSNSFIDLAKDIDQSLLNFLNPVLQVKMFNFLEKNLPYLAETAKEWLRINKTEIERLIEDSIEEYYSSQNNIWGQLKLTIKDIIGLKVTEYFGVVEKGIQKFEDYVNNKATSDITNEVVKFLENKQLGNLITELKINPEKLSGFLYTFINQYLPKLNTSIFDSFLNKRLDDMAGIARIDLQQALSGKIEKFLIKQIKHNLFYTATFTATLQKIVSEKVGQFNQGTFSALLSREKFQELIGYLPMLLLFSRGKFVEKLLAEIQRQLNNRSLAELMPESFKANLKNYLLSSYQQKIPEVVNLLKDHKAGDLYDRVIYNPDRTGNRNTLKDNINLSARPFFKKWLSYSTGRTLKNTKTESIKLHSGEILNQNIQPLSVIGAAIGAATGSLLYFIPGVEGSAGMVVVPATYALLGIGTNWLAFNMLFRPFREKINSGIVTRIKNRLSAKTPDFIAAEVLTQTNKASHTTPDNQVLNQVIEELKVSISANNYAKAGELINQHKSYLQEQITPLISHAMLSSLEANRENLTDFIKTKADQFELKNITPQQFEKYFFSVINQSQSFFKNFIQAKINSYRDQTLAALPEKMRNKINEVIAEQIKTKIDNVTDLINDETNIEGKIKNILAGIDPFLDFNIRIEEFTSLDPEGNFKNKAIGYLNKLIKEKVQEAIQKYIQSSFIEDELAGHKEIRTLFNGDLIFFIKRKMYTALDSVIFGFGLEKLKEEKEVITDRVIASVRESNKDSFMYGLGESLLNIENDIKEIIHLVIDTKLEPYLKTKKWELENILTGYIDYISRKKLEEIGLTKEILNSGNIGNVIDKFIENKNISASINHLSVALVEDIMKMQLSFLLNLVGISSLADIPDKFQTEIITTREEVINNINLNKEKLISTSVNFSAGLMDKFIYALPFSGIFKDVSEAEITDSIGMLVSSIYNSAVFSTYQKKFSDNIYQQLSSKKANELIDITLLETDLQKALEALLKDTEIHQQISLIIKPVTLKLIEQLNTVIDAETKQAIINLLQEALLKSFSTNASALVQSIDLKGAISIEIDNMSAEQTEELFTSIISPHLNRLILSGWVGGLIGIIVVLLT